jgi:glycine cleavage system aminomethyltransferase T
VARTIGLAYLPAEVETGAGIEVEVLGRSVAAVVADDVLVDPANERILA